MIDRHIRHATRRLRTANRRGQSRRAIRHGRDDLRNRDSSGPFAGSRMPRARLRLDGTRIDRRRVFTLRNEDGYRKRCTGAPTPAGGSAESDLLIFGGRWFCGRSSPLPQEWRAWVEKKTLAYRLNAARSPGALLPASSGRPGWTDRRGHDPRPAPESTGAAVCRNGFSAAR